jgi:hypothetical protein
MIKDEMAEYSAELAQLRDTLDTAWDDIESGRVKPIDGQEVFDRLRLKKR